MINTARLFLTWAVQNFGKVAKNHDERAARLVEEAVEICQVQGVSEEVIHRIVCRVYSRPVGRLEQEIGGTTLALMAVAENAGLSMDKCAEDEFNRVMQRDKQWWQWKHQEKVDAGCANLSPVQE